MPLTYPFVVLVKAFKEMFHPVAKRLECSRSQFAPNVRNLTIEQRTRDLVQFTAHSYFTSKSLGRKGTQTRLLNKDHLQVMVATDITFKIPTLFSDKNRISPDQINTCQI